MLSHLQRVDLAQIKARFPEPHTTLFRAIQISFEALREEDPVAAERYLALAVTVEDMAVATAIQRTLWNVDDANALDTADKLLVSRSRSGMCRAVESDLHGLQPA